LRGERQGRQRAEKCKPPNRHGSMIEAVPLADQPHEDRADSINR
jgi:hypothetical protein